MSVLATGAFWSAAAERAVKTAAQTFVATVGVNAALGQIQWAIVGSTTAVAAMLSVATSIASIPVGAPGPSVVKAEELTVTKDG